MWKNEVGGHLSYGHFKREIVEYLKNNFKKGSTVLDLGAGDGIWADLLKEHFIVDGVEIFEPWIEKFNLKNKYRKIFIEDMRFFDFDYYDVIIMGDVLEHLNTKDAQTLVSKIYDRCEELVIGVPFNYAQEETLDGNKYQVHLQPDLTKENFMMRYKGMKPLYTSESLGFFTKEKKYKIAVYTIAKNEEKFVEQWMKSMSEADYICVLDTGSSDGTANKLKELGAIVEVKKINPWRFDVARNESMKLVPDDADILISTDLDEILEPGWADVLRQNWNDNATRRFYKYAWSHNEDGSNARTFWYDKIHSNKEWEWIYPVHEMLVYKGSREQQEERLPETFFLHHYPDLSKSRSSYLELLKLRKQENPDEYYGLLYLGNEYTYHGDYHNAILTYLEIISNDNLIADPLSYSNVHTKLAESYQKINNYDLAIKYAKEGIGIDPSLRDGYGILADIYIELKQYENAVYWLYRALNHTYRHYNWTEQSYYWEDRIYDMLGISYYYMGKYFESYAYFSIAVEAKPYDERLLKNRELAFNKIKEVHSDKA